MYLSGKNDRKRLWVIVTPVFPPALAGGAVYTETLASTLAKTGEDILVITESYPRKPREEVIDFPDGGKLVIVRLFPFRAGRAKVDFRTVLAYLKQAIDFMTIPKIIRRKARLHDYAGAVCLVHFSFFYKPQNLERVLKRVKQKSGIPVHLVADVRDLLYTARHARRIESFDAAICSSEASTVRLRSMLKNDKARTIPIPFEPIIVDQKEDEDILRKYELERRKYIFNANGVVRYKGYREQLDAVKELRRDIYFKDIKYVVAGRCRDWRSEDTIAETTGVMKYLGIIPHKHVAVLNRNALAVLITSRYEAPSRSALEAIAQGSNVVLPPVAEFRRYVPDLIAESVDPLSLADKIRDVVFRKTHPARYPLEKHKLENVIPMYFDIIGVKMELKYPNFRV